MPEGHPIRWSILANAGIAAAMRHNGSGDLRDLQQAVALGEAAEQAAPANSPRLGQVRRNLAGWASRLATLLRERFEAVGEPDDLAEAARLGGRLVKLTPQGSTDAPGELGSALLRQYESRGDRPLIDEAVQLARTALASSPPGHPDWGAVLANLATLLRSRFSGTGDPADLHAAIEANQEAASALEPGSRGGVLTNLATAWMTRFEQSGHLDDLDRAVEAGRASVTAPENEDDAAALSNVGNILLTRFEQIAQPRDLGESIAACRNAVAASRPGQLGHAACLSSLAGALLASFHWRPARQTSKGPSPPSAPP